MLKYSTILYISLIFLTASCDNRSLEELVRTAESYEAKSDFEMANIVYDETIKAYPDYTGSYINKGANLAQLKEYKKAIETYKNGLKTNPQEALFYLNIGFNFNRLEKRDSAIYYFTKGLHYAKQCDPSKVGLLTMTTNQEQNKVEASQIYYERGLDYYEQEEYYLCIEDMKKCIDCGYNLAQSHYMIGACKLSTGNDDEGCEQLHIALEYGDEQAQQQIDLHCK